MADQFDDSNGIPWPLQVQPGYEFAEYYYTANQSMYLGTADQWEHTVTYSYLPAVAAQVGSAGPFTVVDVTNGDTLAFPYDEGRTMLDLSTWLNTKPVNIPVSVTRREHVLEIHTFDGRTYPLANGNFLNPWRPGTAISVADAAETWNFPATGTALSDGGLWWVYDRTTDEVATGYAQDLTTWTSKDADLDSDSDGLPDWFERVVCLDPQNPDSDGDGLQDGWEVKYRLNPFVRQIDSDGDGMSDIWEIAHGLDPLDPGDANLSRNGNGVSNLDEFRAIFGNDLPTSNVDSDGDGIPDYVEIQNGTDPFQSDLLDSDGDGVPDYRDAWPFDPHLQGLPLPVPRYAMIEIHQLAANEQVDKLLLGEGGQVAYQLSTPAEPEPLKTAYYWSGSDVPPVQVMNDPTDPAPAESRGFGGIISITEGGSVFGRWTKNTGDELNGCASFPTHRYFYPSALWSPGSMPHPMAYLGPVPVPEPFYPFGDQPFTRFVTAKDYFLVDRYGSNWSSWTETGTMARLDYSQVYYCADTGLPYFGTKMLATGDFRELRYNEQLLSTDGLDLGSSAGLELAFGNFSPNLNPIAPATLSGGDELTFLTANDLGGCLATAPRNSSNFAASRLFLSDVVPAGSHQTVEITSLFPGSPSSIVALANDDVILTQNCLVAKNATGTYETVYSREYDITTEGGITWVDFNAQHTAVGNQAGSGRAVVLVNDTVYDLATLCGGDSTLQLGLAGGAPVPQVINDDGTIVAVANTSPNGTIVLLVPVDITPRKKGRRAPPLDGLTVKKGDVLEVALAPSYFGQAKQFEGMISWESNQLKGDGTFAGWTSLGPNGTGTEFEYTTENAGIFRLRAVIAGGGQTLEYVRKKDAPFAANSHGVYNETLRAGKPDYIGVVEKRIQLLMRNEAKSWLGKTAYSEANNVAVDPSVELPYVNPPSTKHRPKCNIFVTHVANTVGATTPFYCRYFFVVAAPAAKDDWYTEPEKNVDLDAPGWLYKALPDDPQPGQVIASPVTEPGSLGHGHVGVLDYDGSWINAGAKNVNKLLHLTDPFSKGYKPNTIRTR